MSAYNRPVRDRRWDFLYDRRPTPVKEYVLDRFGAELASELRAWPPTDLAFASEAERARFLSGGASPLRDDVLRLALEIARLDLRREFERIDAHLAQEGHRIHSKAEQTSLHLVARLVTEACLELKERAHGLRLTRADLVSAIDRAERHLFRVTLA